MNEIRFPKKKMLVHCRESKVILVKLLSGMALVLIFTVHWSLFVVSFLYFTPSLKISQSYKVNHG